MGDSEERCKSVHDLSIEGPIRAMWIKSRTDHVTMLSVMWSVRCGLSYDLSIECQSDTPACQRGRLHLCVNVLCMYINIASERRRSVSPHTQWALVTPASRFGSPQPHQAREECLADLVDLQSHKELQRSLPSGIFYRYRPTVLWTPWASAHATHTHTRTHARIPI